MTFVLSVIFDLLVIKAKFCSVNIQSSLPSRLKMKVLVLLAALAAMAQAGEVTKMLETLEGKLCPIFE